MTADAAAFGLPEDAREVLDFWFLPEADPAHGRERREWFVKDEAFDASIRDRFAATIERGLRGELDAWSETPHGALAQVVVLDQFTRNAFRDTPRAFAGDHRALTAASAMVGRRCDEALPGFLRAFVYMPFEHAEGMAMQDEAVRLFTRLAEDAPEASGMLDYAQQHRRVIERFGRFPHRNDILGRRSTAEETVFLRQPGSRF